MTRAGALIVGITLADAPSSWCDLDDHSVELMRLQEIEPDKAQIGLHACTGSLAFENLLADCR
jgi:hypothetical protein